MTERRKSLTVGIPESAAEKLAELADSDYRSPSHEAAVLPVDAIESAFRRACQAAGSRGGGNGADAGKDAL